MSSRTGTTFTDHITYSSTAHRMSSSSSLDYLSGLAMGSDSAVGLGLGMQTQGSVPSLLAPSSATAGAHSAHASASALLALSSLPLLPQMVTKTKKVFVGGVPTSSTVDELREYFSQFGKVCSSCFCSRVLEY